MTAAKEYSSQVMVITGNAAAAHAAMLCRPDVVATYPITPQTEVIEKLFEFSVSGELDAEMVPVEGENSAMNVVTAASVAGEGYSPPRHPGDWPLCTMPCWLLPGPGPRWSWSM